MEKQQPANNQRQMKKLSESLLNSALTYMMLNWLICIFIYINKYRFIKTYMRYWI